jgi:CTP:molybdopterin cytidylyltransferase MocA
VLWGAQYFPRLLELCGDQGARALFGELADQVVEVEMPDDAVLVDIDTQAALDAVLIRYANNDLWRTSSWSH